jgi:hypothetical protein
MVRKLILPSDDALCRRGHSAEDRGEHQRDHDHLQQLHITVTHQIEPADRGFQYRVASAVNAVQCNTEGNAQGECEQDFFRQAPRGMAGLRQTEEQGEEHQQIEDQRQIHEDSDKTCASHILGQLRTGKPNSLISNDLIPIWLVVRRFWNK